MEKFHGTEYLECKTQRNIWLKKYTICDNITDKLFNKSNYFIS